MAAVWAFNRMSVTSESWLAGVFKFSCVSCRQVQVYGRCTDTSRGFAAPPSGLTYT